MELEHDMLCGVEMGGTKLAALPAPLKEFVWIVRTQLGLTANALKLAEYSAAHFGKCKGNVVVKQAEMKL